MILLVERKELKQKKAQWIVPSAQAGGIFIEAWHIVKNTRKSPKEMLHHAYYGQIVFINNENRVLEGIIHE